MKDDLHDKVLIHVMLNETNAIKSMECVWDNDKSHWYCYKNNFCYTDGSLLQYLYLIELIHVRFPHDNRKVKKLGARWNPDDRKFGVFFSESILS